MRITLKKEYINAIIFAAGAISGSILTYFGVKKHFENKAEEEIASAREAYADALSDLYKSKEERENGHTLRKNEGKSTDSIEKVVGNYANRSVILDENDNGLVNYSSFYMKKEEKELENLHPTDDEGEVNIKEGKEVSKQGKPKKPRIISSEAYGSLPGYDYLELYYYQGDGVITGSEDDIIDNPEYLIGDALTKFGFDVSDESTIYVRNDNIQTDIEITKVRGSYADES